MGETQVWQSASGATVSMVVTLDELPQPILRNDDRNPWEMQPAASDTDNGPDEHTVRVAWRPVFDKWDAYLERKAPGTRREYTQKARATFEWVEASLGKSDLREVTWEDLEAYRRAWNSRRPLKPNTVNVWVSAIQSFFRHAVDRLELDRLGVRDLGRKLERYSLEEVNRAKENRAPISKEDLQRVLAVAEAESDFAWSLAARFQWTTIGRHEDLWTVTWGQVELGPPPKVTYPRPSKHGWNAEKLLDAGLARRLKEWKRLKDPQPEDPVFRDPLTSKKVYLNLYNRRFKEYAARAGLKVRVSSHTLRRSANTHGLLQGVPELFLQRQGAWAVRDAWDAYCLQPMETYREAVKSLALD